MSAAGSWEVAGERAQDFVHDGAARGGIELGAERLQLVELQNVAGEDLVGVGDHPLDAAHAELARSRLEPVGTASAPSRLEVRTCRGRAPRTPGALRPRAKTKARGVDQRGEPLQPARRHGGHALGLERAREIDGAGAEALREVVRGKADVPLWRRQSERYRHRPAEPRARLSRPGPDALVEAAEDDDIGLLQARLERSPDREAGMGRPARPRHAASEQAPIEGG